MYFCISALCASVKLPIAFAKITRRLCVVRIFRCWALSLLPWWLLWCLASTENRCCCFWLRGILEFEVRWQINTLRMMGSAIYRDRCAHWRPTGMPRRHNLTQHTARRLFGCNYNRKTLARIPIVVVVSVLSYSIALSKRTLREEPFGRNSIKHKICCLWRREEAIFGYQNQ